MRTPSIIRMALLADYIEAHGPISIRRAMDALKMGNPTRTARNFAPYAAQRGITKNGKGLWMTTKQENWSAMMRCATCIERHGPMTEREMWIETGINDHRAAILKDLREFALTSGRVRYDKASQMWEKTPPTAIAETRTRPDFRPYHHDVYAHAGLRAGAMDYKTLRNPHMQA